MSFNQPEILYQEVEEGKSGAIPFMQLEKGSTPPSALFIASAIKTDEFNEQDEEIVDFVLQMYLNADTIKSAVGITEYNKIREALGLSKIEE